MLYKYISDTSQLVGGWLNILKKKEEVEKNNNSSKWRPVWTLKSIGNNTNWNWFQFSKKFVCHSFFIKETDNAYEVELSFVKKNSIFVLSCFLILFVLLFFSPPFHLNSHDEKKQHSCCMRTLIVFNIFFVIAIALSIAIIYRFGALIKECKFWLLLFLWIIMLGKMKSLINLKQHIWGRDWVCPWNWLMISTIDKNDYVYIYRHRRRSTINIFINTLLFTHKKINNQRSISKHSYHRHCTLYSVYHCMLNICIYIVCERLLHLRNLKESKEK